MSNSRSEAYLHTYFLHLIRCLNFWDNKKFWGAKSGPLTHASAVNQIGPAPGAPGKRDLLQIKCERSQIQIIITEKHTCWVQYSQFSNNINPHLGKTIFNHIGISHLVLISRMIRSSKPWNIVQSNIIILQSFMYIYVVL